jgi:hypothetical protein
MTHLGNSHDQFRVVQVVLVHVLEHFGEVRDEFPCLQLLEDEHGRRLLVQSEPNRKEGVTKEGVVSVELGVGQELQFPANGRQLVEHEEGLSRDWMLSDRLQVLVRLVQLEERLQVFHVQNQVSENVLFLFRVDHFVESVSVDFCVRRQFEKGIRVSGNDFEKRRFRVVGFVFPIFQEKSEFKKIHFDDGDRVLERFHDFFDINSPGDVPV